MCSALQRWFVKGRRLGILLGFLVGLAMAAVVEARSFPVAGSEMGVVREGGWGHGVDQPLSGAAWKLLRRVGQGPRDAQESNYFVDLWDGVGLATFARSNGLTNNHALLVDSHGGMTVEGYRFWPREVLLRRNERVPQFSVKHLAAWLGPEQAATIHNVVLAGCNEEGGFDSIEVRRWFVNATNVVYMTPGFRTYKPMFHQALTLPSKQVRSFYGELRRTESGRWACRVSVAQEPGAEELGYFVADLYRAGEMRPFLRKKAGRELLDPGVGWEPPRTQEMGGGGVKVED